MSIAALVLLAAGCGGGAEVSLTGRPLAGLITGPVRALVGDAIHFRVDAAAPSWPDCNVLDVRSTFDGVPANDGPIGGEGSGPYNVPVCNVMAMTGSTATAGGWRDGTLDVVSADEAGGNGTYTGVNLMGLRQLNPVETLTVRRGEALQLRHEPTTDVVLLDGKGRAEPAMWPFGVDLTVAASPVVSAGAEPAPRFSLETEVVDGIIQAVMPADVAAGRYNVFVQYRYAVETAVCEGFSSCEVLGDLRAEFVFDVI